MASVPILLVFYVFLFAGVNVKAQTKNSNTITKGCSLSTNANNSSWSSPSGYFAFGFYPQGDGYAVGIWLVNQTGRVIVWTANRDDPPVSSNATLELTAGGVMLLHTDKKGKEILITDGISSPAVTSAAMLDGGNFELINGSDHVIWQSFDYVTDTILGGQNLSFPNRLASSKSTSDQSSGRFLLIMQDDGNLVSYPANISNLAENAYWSSGSSGNDSVQLRLNHSGFLFLQKSSKRPLLTLSNGDPGENRTVIHRATLDDDGIFRLYSHYFRSNTRPRMKVMWSSLQNHCEVKGFCGLNSYCQVVRNNSECICYPGFVRIDPGNKFLDCNQNFSEVGCRDDEDNPSLRYNFTSFKNMSWGDQPYTVEPLEEADCRNSCLRDCNCWAVSYYSNSCGKFSFPLRFGKTNVNISETALFKIVLKNIVTPNHSRPVLEHHGAVESKNNTILVLALSLGSVACLCFVFAVSSFIVYKHRYRCYAKLLENAHLGLAEDFSLQSFSYNELERATNGFKEEIGKGTFGAVYRGILSESGNKAIAVKRLEKVVEEGVREFRAEMTTIGRTHHRNLVQLLGFCIEGSKKLLVYEFMSNGSLADRLFKTVSPPKWRERVRFVLDVARGIFYLHEECGVHIIHCNLKPQNILLDDTWTAKISDFGLARLLMPNQAKTSMGLQGTSIGYSAPEWEKSALISVKADIYSFGIVLLEIICCRRNIDVNVSTPDEITLSKWVYTCFKAGELSKLVREEDEVDFPTLERMIKVGLWCIQDDPASRPLMKKVILMLEGTLVIPAPPSPELVILP